MDILTAIVFLTIRVIKATEGNDDKLLRKLEYLRGRHGIALEVLADASYAVHDEVKGHRGAIAV